MKYTPKPSHADRVYPMANITPYSLHQTLHQSIRSTSSTYVHRDHEATALRCRYLSLIDRNDCHQSTDSKSIDESSNQEHGVVDRSCTDSGTNDKNHGGNLNGTLAAELVGAPGTDCTADGRARTVDSIEGTDVLSSPGIPWLALRCETKGDVEARLSDGRAMQQSVEAKPRGHSGRRTQ